MPLRTEIPRILRDEVNRARTAYENAHTEFKAITTDIPSGIPAPDGALRIRNAGAKYRDTMEEYNQALDEFNVFIKNGTIPERLKEG